MKKLNYCYEDLINLQFSSRNEVFLNNELGTYSYTSICNYNTRKYHGDFVVPIQNFNNELHVLLSSLDISIIKNNKEFNLAIHKYKENYYAPHGHKYLKEFSLYNGYPTFRYCVGDICLTLSKVIHPESNQLLIAIQNNNENENIQLRLHPNLAFRNINDLTQCNFTANTKVQRIPNGIKTKLYEGFPEIFLQTSTKSEFIVAPTWYKGIEYYLEQLRGYEFKEDLFVPGYIETNLQAGKTIIVSASLREEPSRKLLSVFKNIINEKKKIKSSNQALKHASKQFFFRNANNKLEMVAGHPWYKVNPRDIFIANPTLMLKNKQPEAYLNMVNYYLNNLEIETGVIWGKRGISADAPLWLFWSLHEYKQSPNNTKIWDIFGEKLCQILEAYKNNKLHNISFHPNGLIYISPTQTPMTWMDSSIDGKCVVDRHGFVVEVCSLWYNAIRIALDFASEANDSKFIQKWTPWINKIEQNFENIFSQEEYGFLADFVTDNHKDFTVRPNQLIAVALPYTPVSKNKTSGVLQVIEEELLTLKGIRSLSPQDSNYQENYSGNHYKREIQAHQGAVYPWLLPFYCKTQDAIYKHSSITICTDIYKTLEDELYRHGVGTLGEMFTADPPYNPVGAFSMAKSISAMILIKDFIKQLKKQKNDETK